jgi:GTP 3',8-cyclase
MPNNNQCQTSEEQMSADEIAQIAEVFYNLGVDKIRLTGGEPLARKDFKDVISALGKTPVTLALTTNGLLLDKYLPELKENNFTKINISLDTLKPERFKAITGNNSFQTVYKNILKAVDSAFEVKVNAVVMKDFNDDEIEDFAKLTLDLPITMRFIEFMPFKDNNWSFGRIIKHAEIIKKLTAKFNLNTIETSFSSTAQDYQIENAVGKIGVIGTVSKPFCDSCNRIRITADGKLKSCLFGHSEYDLLSPLRKNEDLVSSIKDALQKKPHQHGGKQSFSKKPDDFQNNRNMHSIGG